MKNIFLIFIFTILSTVVIAAGSGGGESKNTASKDVKAATKFDIGKKWVSKAKKFEKKKQRE